MAGMAATWRALPRHTPPNLHTFNREDTIVCHHTCLVFESALFDEEIIGCMILPLAVFSNVIQLYLDLQASTSIPTSMIRLKSPATRWGSPICRIGKASARR